MGSNMLKQEDVSEPMNQDQALGPNNTRQSGQQQDDDEKSDFDPLFDDDPDAEGDSTMNTQPAPQASGPTNNPTVPSNAQPQQSRQPVVWGNAPNAPPVLDPVTYSLFSPDVLMTAAIDGQVMLWDKRVHSPGFGVGRLPMGEKTRPWCVSVSSRAPS